MVASPVRWAPVVLALGAVMTACAGPGFPPVPSAGPLRFQQRLAGMLPKPLTVRWELRFQGSAVTLRAQRSGRASDEPAVSVAYQGTWRRDPRGLELHLMTEEPREPFPQELNLRCLRAVLDVLPGHAELRSGDACNGDGPPPRWEPARTRDVPTWLCALDDEGARPWNGFEQHGPLAFAAGAGLEWLYVNNDCSGQEGAFRAAR